MRVAQEQIENTMSLLNKDAEEMFKTKEYGEPPFDQLTSVSENDIIDSLEYLRRKMSLIFVDCEGHGPAAGLNDESKFEFGAVEYKTHNSFHGVFTTSPGNTRESITPRTWTQPTFDKVVGTPHLVMSDFADWLKLQERHPKIGTGRPVFVSDNVAYDWQFINYYFHRELNYNPFGHSGRRISDFFAGLTNNFRNTQRWKKFRKTTHDHNPVHDALGNVEAFETICKKYSINI